MQIYLLHDPRFPAKLEQSRLELARQGISDYHIEFAEPYPGPPHAAINAMHKKLVELAKFNKLKEVCIMEDDVQFPAADGWDYFLKKMPKMAFDIYLACTYGEVIFGLPYIEGDKSAWAKVPCGFHCYVIRERHYNRFLAVPEEAHIDTGQAMGTYPVCYPFAAIQRPGWSGNARKEVDYNTKLNKKEVYGWELK